MHWYDKAVEELENDLSEGLISQKEYETMMGDLHEELRQAQQDCADEAYNNYY